VQHVNDNTMMDVQQHDQTMLSTKTQIEGNAEDWNNILNNQQGIQID
jgi:hypothetical protein